MVVEAMTIICGDGWAAIYQEVDVLDIFHAIQVPPREKERLVESSRTGWTAVCHWCIRHHSAPRSGLHPTCVMAFVVLHPQIDPLAGGSIGSQLRHRQVQ